MGNTIASVQKVGISLLLITAPLADNGKQQMSRVLYRKITVPIQMGRRFARVCNMKKFIHITLLLFTVSFVFSSCELVGDIFQAGLIVGIIAVVIVLALIIWILRKIF